MAGWRAEIFHFSLQRASMKAGLQGARNRCSADDLNPGPGRGGTMAQFRRPPGGGSSGSDDGGRADSVTGTPDVEVEKQDEQ